MLISALRQNHPKLLIKKFEVLGKGFFILKLGNLGVLITPKNLVIFAAPLSEVAKNFAQS